MTDLWLAAGLLSLVALGLLLVPILRAGGPHAEQDRAALNVELYQERVAELEAQQQAGVLDAAQLQRGRDEAARELLTDTETLGGAPARPLGRGVPLAVAVLLPVVALGLYLHFGAADKVELAREFAQAPSNLQDMTTRLERTVQAQPESAEGWYFLGRAYMAQQRPGDASQAFERAVALAGRQPELLGQWAQAAYFANGKQWNDRLQALADEALREDPKEPTSLGLLGIAAFEGARYQEAIDYWKRLLAALPADDASRAALQGGIDRAAERLAAGTSVQDDGTAKRAEAPAVRLKVRLSLAEAIKDKVRPEDTVYLFARAVGGPPMPLAAKRLRVAQLPLEVELSDADAMMAQMKLSGFAQVELLARVSRAGQPTHGEWIGRNPPLATSTRAVQHLTIDRPDQQESRP
ncbi:c-type cytochrome biogenesis protein CcmI [Pseudomonas fulva]|nr:c-type cytochrome biogenesis protein CcmI [Pseudomonas fulva]MBF8779213.1 c-type cytochrome biogenesis protein CcmI [Pseudomonas fulva]